MKSQPTIFQQAVMDPTTRTRFLTNYPNQRIDDDPRIADAAHHLACIIVGSLRFTSFAYAEDLAHQQAELPVSTNRILGNLLTELSRYEPYIQPFVDGALYPFSHNLLEQTHGNTDPVVMYYLIHYNLAPECFVAHVGPVAHITDINDFAALAIEHNSTYEPLLIPTREAAMWVTFHSWFHDPQETIRRANKFNHASDSEAAMETRTAKKLSIKARKKQFTERVRLSYQQALEDWEVQRDGHNERIDHLKHLIRTANGAIKRSLELYPKKDDANFAELSKQIDTYIAEQEQERAANFRALKELQVSRPKKPLMRDVRAQLVQQEIKVEKTCYKSRHQLI